MPTYEEIRPQLLEPFPIEWLDFRPGGKGSALVYVEVWHYLDVLDRICPDLYDTGKAEVILESEGQIAVQIPLTIAGRTLYGESDLSTPTKAAAQAFKRAAAKHGLGRYLYNAPDLKDAYAGYDLKVDKSVLIAQCYEAWGLDLPRDFKVVDAPPARNTRPQSNGSRQPSRQESSSDDEQNPAQHKGKLSEKQCNKLYSVGITDADIRAMSTEDARQAVTDAFEGDDADAIRERYVKAAAAPAQSGGRRQRW